MDSTKAQVELYTKPGCPYCQALRRKLEHDGTPYVEHDVQSNPAALHRMLTLNDGRRNVPTIVLDGQVTVGFHGM